MPKVSLIFAGCYTEGDGGRGAGISVAAREAGTGSLAPLGTAAATPAPSFLAAHPDLPVLYSVHERAEGAVSAWRVGPGGALTRLGGAATGGASPCHLAVVGEYLAVANYHGGSVALHPLAPDGSVGQRSDLAVHSGHGPASPAGTDPVRQEGPHPHHVSPDGAGGVRAVDLGLDAVYSYPIDRATGRFGRPVVSRLRPGMGPRHLARGAGGLLYVAGELDASVSGYQVNGETGGLGELATVPVPGGGQPSEIAASAAFLYVASRGPDLISVFALDGLSFVGQVASGGAWPRHLAIVDGHLYVANERSHSVVAFRLDPASGLPEPTGDVWHLPSPTCVLPVQNQVSSTSTTV